MGFGPQYVFKQTPKIIQAIQNGLNFFCAGVLYFLPFVARILHTNTDDLSQIMGIAVLFVNTLGVMCGVTPITSTKRNEIDN